MHIQIDNLHDLPVPAHARSFFDPEKTREWIKESALHSFKEKLNKIETPDLKLHVTDIHISDTDHKFSPARRKEAILNKEDLTIPIKGKFQLIDRKTGHVVEEKTTTIAHLPYVTDNNTVILNGSEYLVTNQQRLKPGVYTRIKQSGQVEAHINLQGGMSGKVIFMADKALFVYEVGTTKIKLYGLLHGLGVPDADMEKAWGHEIFLANKATYEGNEIDKLYGKVFSYEKVV